MSFRKEHEPVDALYFVGHWLIEQDRFDDAKHLFRTMVHLVPTDERGWLGLGHCHERMNEVEIAAKLYALVPQAACSSQVRAAVALGRALRKLQRDAEADEAYARAADLVDAVEQPELALLIALEAQVSS